MSNYDKVEALDWFIRITTTLYCTLDDCERMLAEALKAGKIKAQHKDGTTINAREWQDWPASDLTLRDVYLDRVTLERWLKNPEKPPLVSKAEKVKAWRKANPELYAAQKHRTAKRQAKKRAETKSLTCVNDARH